MKILKKIMKNGLLVKGKLDLIIINKITIFN